MLQKLLQTICTTFKKLFKIFCPCLYLAIFSKKGEYPILKKVCGFLYGVLLGILFYELIIVDLDITEYSAIAVGLVLCLMLGLGVSLSAQIRCIALLSMPNFGGKAGRAVLKALVLAYIVSGPIANLANNGREVARVFACSASLTVNLTRSRFDLMFKPFQQALFGMKTDVAEVKDTVRSIRGVVAPVTGELEGESEMKKMKEENDYLDELQGDSKRSQEIDKKYNTTGEQIEAERYKKNYLKKIETRCEDQLSRAGKKCRNMFEKAYNKCYDKVSWVAAWILCWPMKLTFVCNIVEALGGSKTCDPAQDMDPGFGEGYEYLKNSRQKLTQNFKDVKLQYKIGKIKQLDDIRNAAEASKSVLHEVKKKKSLLDSILTIFKRILAFVFLKIIIDALNYHDSYLRDIEFDNIYITDYFREWHRALILLSINIALINFVITRKIDARRRQSSKPALLPLKKVERLKLVDPWSISPLKSEREALVGQTAMLLLEMITATVFILLDRLFYELLDIIRRHARIDYTQTGHHDMNIDVKGVGMIASVLRNICRGFNIKKRIKVVRSNAQCLPQPSQMPNYYFYKIYGTYFAVWLTMMTQAYILRLRSAICGFFYRKREKKRIIFRYNESLKRRIGFFRYMKQKIKQMVHEERLEEDLNFFKVLRIRCPRAFEWLRIFPFARRRCLICRDPEPFLKKNIKGNFTICPTPTCHMVYCLECWYDLGETCYACAVDEMEVSEAEETEDEN